MDQETRSLLNWLHEEVKELDSGLGDWNLLFFDKQRVRFASDLEIVHEHYEDGPILDVGAVPCHMTTLLNKLGYPVIGLDVKPESSGQLISKFGLDVRKCDIETERFPFEDESFKLVLFTEVFEHMRIDPIHTLSELRRVLGKDGKLILSTPNLYASKMIVRFLLGRGLFSPYEQFEMIRTLGFMGHVREYSPAEMREFVQRCGFRVEEHLFRTYKEYGPLKRIIYDKLSKLKQFQVLICSKADIPHQTGSA